MSNNEATFNSQKAVDKIHETLQFLKLQCDFKPEIGIVLGSGLGTFVSELEVIKKIPFATIPNFLAPTVEGHLGNLIFGNCGSRRVVALQGRNHYYEGHSMEFVVFPTRVIALLGIETLLLTNSAGGLADAMESGDFMVIDDHINLMGANPLMGPNIKEFGPRFPDMTEAYDQKLSQQLFDLAKTLGVRCHRGIYAAMSGPTYETPAEVRYLRQLGCSAVGMSTVPECIAANHLGLRVAALSCITNKAAGLSKTKLNHAEVTDTAKRVETQFSMLLKHFVSEMR